MRPTGRLKDKPALITGAASGIGAATARLFAAEGAPVLVCDINVTRGKQVVTEIQDCGGTAFFRRTDVTDRKDVRKMVKDAEKALGGLAVLVNNALALPREDAGADEAWNTTIASCLDAVWAASIEAVPLLEKSGAGSIVTIASVAGARFGFSDEAYCAAKAGVIGLTRRIAKTYGPVNIRANCICPGLIETPLWKTPGEPEPEFAGRWRSMTPLKRAGTPDEVARVALFLASDDSSYINGEEIVVDGGFSTGFLFETEPDRKEADDEK